jgi:hypothetical protein
MHQSIRTVGDRCHRREEARPGAILDHSNQDRTKQI